MININNDNNLTGGKVIASGGFGCIFQPALKCNTQSKTKNKHTNRISKLMTKKHARTEYKEITKFQNLLKQIPHYSDYFLLNDFVLCKPTKLSFKDLTNYKKKCKALNKKNITVKKVNSSLNKLLTLNMPYGGVDLKHVDMSFTKLNVALIRLLTKGIVPMNQLEVYHCDIKESNILIKNNFARLIDWGLSTEFKHGQPIPKVLCNRPFQYNIPFSNILFNKYFLKEYHGFLKKDRNPSDESIRKFVRNYIVLWSNIRGVGHLYLINKKMAQVFNHANNKNDNDKKRKVIYDFTYYYIIEYIFQILKSFTKNGTFELYTYFSEVFIKNIDIWGFVTTYYMFINHKNKNTEVFKKIKYAIVHCLFENPTKPIDVKEIISVLE